MRLKDSVVRIAELDLLAVADAEPEVPVPVSVEVPVPVSVPVPEPEVLLVPETPPETAPGARLAVAALAREA